MKFSRPTAETKTSNVSAVNMFSSLLITQGVFFSFGLLEVTVITVINVGRSNDANSWLRGKHLQPEPTPSGDKRQNISTPKRL